MDAIERIVAKLEGERDLLDKAINVLRTNEQSIAINDLPKPKLRRGSEAWRQHQSEAAKRRWRRYRKAQNG